MLRTLKKYVLTFFVLILGFFALSCLPAALPNDRVNEHVTESNAQIKQEGTYPIINGNDWGSRLDNFTDQLMLSKAQTDTHQSVVQSAMDVRDYPRYWHGYLFFLKPLLMIGNYQATRQLYSFVWLLLLGINCYWLAKKINLQAVIALVFSLALVRVMVFPLSLQFSHVFLIGMLFNWYLLTRPDNYFTQRRYFLDFFIVGALVNFIDLLTVPLVPLGMSLVTLLAMRNQTQLSLKDDLSLLLGVGFSFGLGYGLTWVAKWVIASVILQRNVVKDAIEQIFFRTGGAYHEQTITYPMVLTQNLSLVANRLTVAFGGLTVIGLLIQQFRSTGHWRFTWRHVALLLTCLIPFVWYFVLKNHSFVHYYFTYRELFITSYAGLMLVGLLKTPTSPSQVSAPA
ncbi:MAG: hypothetical protein Q4A55_05665 [Aerococcus sp.]|nr:hypothetical protein [Aerococcus sp.]